MQEKYGSGVRGREKWLDWKGRGSWVEWASMKEEELEELKGDFQDDPQAPE